MYGPNSKDWGYENLIAQDIQGELFPKKKNPSQNPRAKSAREKRNRKKGDNAQRNAEAQRGGEQQKPEDIWPNYPNMLKIIKEGVEKHGEKFIDVLKILPALGGVNQLAEGYRYSGDPNSMLIDPRRSGREQGPATLQEHNMKLKIQGMLRPKLSQVNYGEPTDLDKYFQKVGYPNRNQTDEERLKIMRGAPKSA